MQMRKVLVAAVFLMVAVLASAAVRTAAFRVDGMNTEDEVRRVTTSLKKTPGVSDAVGDPKSQVVMVRYEDTKAKAADLTEAVDIAGFTLTPLETKNPRESENTRAAKAIGDFNSVLGHTRQALEQNRYGLVRNLALAMKVRKDALVALSAPAPPKSKGKPPTPPSGNALGQQFSKAVEDFAAAAEALDEAQVNALFPPVKRSFRKLADSYDLDSLLAAPPQPGHGSPSNDSKSAQPQEKSLADQLKDISAKYM
jgi:copper chaperone CopZ